MDERRFEWDMAKAESNLQKHSISFEAASSAFDDSFALIAPDEKHSNVEHRQRLIGEADGGVLVIAFTMRAAGSVIRLISARKASRKERMLYEAYKNIPV